MVNWTLLDRTEKGDRYEGEHVNNDVDKVAMIQAEFRDLLRSMRELKAGGSTLEEQLMGAKADHEAEVVFEHSDESIVNLATAIYYAQGEVYEHLHSILRSTFQLLDHLDVLGMEIRYKQ